MLEQQQVQGKRKANVHVVFFKVSLIDNFFIWMKNSTQDNHF